MTERARTNDADRSAIESIQMPAPDHEEFDAICARVDDFEPLPDALRSAIESEERERIAPLDEMILAGLVSPY